MKTLKLCNIIAVISVVLIISSCSYPHYYYSQNIHNVPMFRESVEFSGLAAGSFGAVNPSFEMQAAFAFPAHIALGGGFMTGGNDHSGEYYEDFSKFNYFEGMFGFYMPFNNKGIFEVYAGYGEGNERHAFAYRDFLDTYWNQDGTAEMAFSKIFIQPDIGLRSKAIEGAFSLRVSKVNFKKITYANTTYRLEELQDLQKDNESWLLEPGFTFRAGAEPVKFQFQGIFSVNPSNPGLSFERFRFNVGVHFSIGKRNNTPSDHIPIQ